MKLSIKKLAEQIEADNEIFNNMSKAEKRVQVARDCLDRIRLKQFTPEQGITCKIYDFDFEEKVSSLSIKDVINKQTIPSCEACAKGGLFLSYVGRVNQFNFEDINDASALDSSEMIKLLEIFEPIQLDGIEAAFEGLIISDEFYEEDEGFLDACEMYFFNINWNSTTDLLKSICKNIIKNSGEFVPTDYISPNAIIK